jgi:hypothetical protein
MWKEAQCGHFLRTFANLLVARVREKESEKDSRFKLTTTSRHFNALMSLRKGRMKHEHELPAAFLIHVSHTLSYATIVSTSIVMFFFGIFFILLFTPPFISSLFSRLLCITRINSRWIWETVLKDVMIKEITLSLPRYQICM